MESDNLSRTRDELTLLLDELRSFSANRTAGIHRKCIANLYYAAFHAVRALLFFHGLDTRTHEGTQRLFAAHFVKPGLMPKAHFAMVLDSRRRYRDRYRTGSGSVFDTDTDSDADQENGRRTPAALRECRRDALRVDVAASPAASPPAWARAPPAARVRTSRLPRTMN